MNPETILGVIAQLALIVVGFSGLVAVIGQRNSGTWSEPDIARVRVMITSSFRVLFLSLLPFIFLHFELAEKTVWICSSGIAAITGATQLLLGLNIARRVSADSTSNTPVQRTIIVSAVTIFMIHLSNATGIGFSQAFGPYLLALLISFTIPCVMFLRLLQTAFENND